MTKRSFQGLRSLGEIYGFLNRLLPLNEGGSYNSKILGQVLYRKL
ncbi:hypothetical protein LEP1GSC125_1009 [Leptospira mayottensis 200901122]|uniref:Uncharacterized protein n=1 Tax=Leptospira mayottensis 200901122 TaxID=1193010 RepID=A0AA87MLV5_9LEPT|nr:hypothetical protein LEP1GSC125_1009 [Leptospira mayottensis 200901122]